MLRKLNSTSVLMRIFIGESDKHHSRPLYQFLVEMFRREKLAGVTVLRGITGFGARSHLHTANILRLSQDLPMVVEVVDTQENIDRILPEVEKAIGDGLITIENVRVIRYGLDQH